MTEKNFFPEAAFIVCRRRKSHPKISPLICGKSCPRMKSCPEYFDYLQPNMFERCPKRETKGKTLPSPGGEGEESRKGEP